MICNVPFVMHMIVIVSICFLSLVDMYGLIAYEVVTALAYFWVMCDVEGKKALGFWSPKGVLCKML